jgi:hypothetical protein
MEVTIETMPDITGEKFGFLTAVEQTDLKGPGYSSLWKCECNCGRIIYTTSVSLVTAGVVSCGHKNCLAKENNVRIKHGESRSRLYSVWSDLKQRCYNMNRHTYKSNGKLGIKVCDEWIHDFMKFYMWSITNGYKDDLFLRRKDLNLDYTPDNCVWGEKTYVKIKGQVIDETDNAWPAHSDSVALNTKAIA